MRLGFRRDDKQSQTFRLERRELLDEQALRRAARDDSSPPFGSPARRGSTSRALGATRATCDQHAAHSFVRSIMIEA
jgi:hypothetical protein